MRKILTILLASCLLLGLLSGCQEEEAEATQVTTPPTSEATETTAPAEESTEPEEVLEETEEPSPLNTKVLRSEDPELKVDFILLALNPEGPFLSEGVTFNETGADALIQWLMTEQAQTLIGEYGLETYGEPAFTMPEGVQTFSGWLPRATEENKTIHLMVADSLEETGLLDVLLPVFEETYGYEVDVQTASATGAITMAKLAMYDLVLTETSNAAETFVSDGYARPVGKYEDETLTLCAMEYLLCGPKNDPAKAADCETIQDAFAAIAAGEHRFLSRGDDSSAHKLEQSLWEASPEGESWYISVGTEMGPLLVMNEFEGGYVLTDKLTWLQFYQAEGII